MTSIFLSPAEASTTVNSVADLAKIVEDLSSLTVLEAAELAKLLEEKWGVSAAAAVAVAAGPAGRLVLLGIGPEHAGELGRRRVDDLGDLGRGSLDEAHELGAQFVERGGLSRFSPINRPVQTDTPKEHAHG
jgi:hypothetical protein